MRTALLPLTLLLTVVLIGCTDDVPTALSAGANRAAARAAVNGAALPFRGTLDSASHTSQYDPATNTVHIRLEGTGTATHLGRYTLVIDIVVPDPTTVTTIEQFTLTAANGDRLFATGTGRGSRSEDGLALITLESATITGGTGRFAGATGSFVLRQVIPDATLISYGSFDGTITLAHRQPHAHGFRSR